MNLFGRECSVVSAACLCVSTSACVDTSVRVRELCFERESACEGVQSDMTVHQAECLNPKP
jgi:hypothetical protein